MGTQRSVLKLRDAGMVVDDAPQLQVYRPISGQRIADVVSNFIAHPPLKLRKSSIAKYRNALSSFTVNILAAVAEHEASMISARTKAALAAAKARGVVSGGQRGSLDRMWPVARKGNAASAAVRRAAAAKRNEDLLPVIADIRGAGRTSPRQIADSLNDRGISAARGGAWSSVQVRRVLANSRRRQVLVK